MAGGKLSPRQRMINMMYLVYIAMMAMNMSKEVLSAFGLMNERLEESNVAADIRNNAFMQGLQQKAEENEKQYAEVAKKAQQISAMSSDLDKYIEDLKSRLLADVKDPKDYQVMDKNTVLDNIFFVSGGKYSEEGQEFVNKINSYREEVSALLSEPAYADLRSDVAKRFSTGDENGKVKDRENVSRDWLEYHYYGFPMVASITKLTQIQADIKHVESNVLSKLLEGELISQVSIDNYQAIVVLDKNAFYQGEQVTGRVVLGRYDDKTVPTRIDNLPGSKIENGQAVFSFGAGAVGEHDIKGQFVFTEGGEEKPVEIVGKYVVVPKPNSATISADKMNSIYRGVDNPMTISFAGISDNNVTASAPGLRSVGSGGKYMWRPDAIQGTEATVSVTGKLPDGTSVSDKKTFIVRNIPAPVASIRGREGTHRGNKNDLLNSTVAVKFPDFVFDINVNVTQFEVSVPGSPRVVCQGNRFNAAAQAAINKAKVGDIVVIGNVKTQIPGSPVIIRDSSPFAWEIQ